MAAALFLWKRITPDMMGAETVGLHHKHLLMESLRASQARVYFSVIFNSVPVSPFFQRPTCSFTR